MHARFAKQFITKQTRNTVPSPHLPGELGTQGKVKLLPTSVRYFAPGFLEFVYRGARGRGANVRTRGP